MLKKTSILAISSFFIFTGCGGSTSESSYSSTLRVNNTTAYDVYQLYIKPSTSTSWGTDMIPADNYIPEQTIVDFETTLCDSDVDVKATGLLGDPVWLFEVNLKCGTTQEIILAY